MSGYAGEWHRNFFVVPVPEAIWPSVQLIQVKLAPVGMKIVGDQFAFGFPRELPNAEKWKVSPHRGGSLLRVEPPQLEQSSEEAIFHNAPGTIIGAQGNITGPLEINVGRDVNVKMPALPAIQVLLPRSIPIRDKL